MSRDQNASRPPGRDNGRGRLGILALATSAAILYAGLAVLGDLTAHTGAFLAIHGALLVVMAAAWWVARGAGPRVLGLALGAALLFRVVMALGSPALSDDVYRYVWDGRVQLHGIHPYLHAPADPALESLRDSDWERINHPELETIYPPLAQVLFAGLAALGAGVRGFKMAAGLADFAVVLALAYLLRRLSLPPDRVLLYA